LGGRHWPPKQKKDDHKKGGDTTAENPRAAPREREPLNKTPPPLQREDGALLREREKPFITQQMRANIEAGQ